jgi:Uma2 family endonuclease
MKDKIQDFISMGVAQVWIFDPKTRTAMVCDGTKMVDFTHGSITLPGTPITLDLAEVFSALDEA